MIIKNSLQLKKAASEKDKLQQGENMKYYKLKNIRSPMVFSIEEIDTILKYRFNAQVCSRSLIHKSYLEKGVKDRTYRIKDLNVIEEMRLPEEREQIRNTLSEMTALGLEIQAMDKGEEYFIYLEFDVENRIVNTIVMGQECRYLLFWNEYCTYLSKYTYFL